VPPARRAKPYIYSDAEINGLLAAALSLPPANALRRWTYHCLFGLIAVAGLRHSEALDLCRDDVDLDQGVLTVRESKFGKTRLVPLHATTVAVLSDYAARRDAHLGAPRSPYFFVAERGGRLLHQYVHRVFWRLSREVGLRQEGQRNGPRNLPVPYDFDSTGLVDPPKALPAEGLGIRRVTQRVYRGRCRDRASFEASLAKYRGARGSIEALIASAPLTERARKKTSKFVAEFFTTIDDPKDLDKEFFKSCPG
jgi:integrase